MRLILLLSVSVAVFLAAPASAAQLVYDPFLLGADPNNGNPATGEYDLGPVIGQNPTVGPNSFFNGGWVVDDTTALNGTILSTGLSYLGAPAAGGSLRANGGNTRQRRYITTPWDATATGTRYMSFLVNFGTGFYDDGISGNDMGYRAVELWDADDVFAMNIAYNTFSSTLGSSQQNPATARMYLDQGGAHTILDGSPQSFMQDGITHLVVLKFVLSDLAGQDSLFVFLDPSEIEEPVIAAASRSNLNFTLGAIGGITLYGGSGTGPTYDELRVGTTFADVVPDFPLKGDCCGSGPVGSNPDGPDDQVDIDDYNAIFAHLNLTNQPSHHGDVNGDGKVTIADFRIWKDNRTDVGSISGIESNLIVPEPGTVVLLAAGLAMTTTKRNSRLWT